jgi:hypothetical protein
MKTFEKENFIYYKGTGISREPFVCINFTKYYHKSIQEFRNSGIEGFLSLPIY